MEIEKYKEMRLSQIDKLRKRIESDTIKIKKLELDILNLDSSFLKYSKQKEKNLKRVQKAKTSVIEQKTEVIEEKPSKPDTGYLGFLGL